MGADAGSAGKLKLVPQIKSGQKGLPWAAR